MKPRSRGSPGLVPPKNIVFHGRPSRSSRANRPGFYHDAGGVCRSHRPAGKTEGKTFMRSKKKNALPATGLPTGGIGPWRGPEKRTPNSRPSVRPARREPRERAASGDVEPHEQRLWSFSTAHPPSLAFGREGIRWGAAGGQGQTCHVVAGGRKLPPPAFCIRG